ncbi:MAG: hypothetical protein JST11_27985 [Acidobacteria bacterium]|nr:hypothetical protein [Acidobacteriota bacterium]
MRNNETGEFELVVGDRQLLSAFFIVVLLCAVAFAMGYVVGQNAPRSGKITADATPPAQAATNAGDSRPQPLAPAPSTAPPTAATDNPAPPDSSPQPTTQASQGAAPSQAPAQTPPAPTAPPKQAEAPAGNTPVAAEDLPAGNYWQVMAVAEQQAQMLRTTLKDHGFSVYLSPGSKGLIRVLVGPYADTQSLGKAKSDLESAGMHPLRYKP